MEKTYGQQLEEMKGKQWIYKDICLEILGYLLFTGESGQDAEIYTNRMTIETNMIQLPKVLKSFHPIHKQAEIIAREQQKSATFLNPEVIGEVRETVLAQLRELRENPTPEAIAKSKAINESISALSNIAKTELEYRRLYEKINGKK